MEKSSVRVIEKGKGMSGLRMEGRVAKIFCALAGGLFAVLVVLGLHGSWVNEWSLKDEFLVWQKDSVWMNLLGWVLCVLACYLIYCMGKRLPFVVPMDAAAIAVSSFACVLSIYWVWAADVHPGGDQHALCYFAEAFSRADYTSLERGGYLAGYSHQLGVFSFVRMLYVFFGAECYKVFQLFNAFMMAVLIFSGYQVVKRISDNSKTAQGCYLLLALTCAPMYFYVPFVYGEIASTALVMFSVLMFLEILEQFSWGKACVMTITLGLAVQFRMNVWICLIAFLIVAAVKILQDRNWKNIVTLVCILLGTVVMQWGVKAAYSGLISQDTHSIPAITYVAMGMNDDKENAGWHNNYDVDCFAQNNFDVERTQAASAEYIRGFLQKCRQDPGYAVDFYYRKFSAQWNAPMYQSLAMNNNLGEAQSEFAENVYFGKLRQLLEKSMNIYQLVIYGTVLLSLIWGAGHWFKIEKYTLLIAVYGGFLFSLLWEAKTRYVFPYFVMMIPYAAVGLAVLMKEIDKKRKKKRT